MSKGTDLNEHVKRVTCQWCDTPKRAEVGPLRLCPNCDKAAVSLAATSLGKPPAEG